MKTSFIKPHLFIAAMISLALASCSQSYYKHARVRIETTEKQASVTPAPAQAQPTSVENIAHKNENMGNIYTNEPVKNIPVNERRIKTEKNTQVKTDGKTTIFHQMADRLGFQDKIDQLKETQRVAKANKVEGVKKTSILGWILGIIFLFIGFAIFLALALIFLYVIVNFVPYYVFLILAIAAGVIGVLILILGLANVFA